MIKMQLTKFKSFEQVDREKLKEVIESGFGKKLVEDYFEYTLVDSVYVAQHNDKYAGAAVLEQISNDHFYLDKWVVAEGFQNNGVGTMLWLAVAEHAHKLTWRAKPENKANQMYINACSGMQKFDKWIIYWKGISPDEIANGIAYSLQKKETLEAML